MGFNRRIVNAEKTKSYLDMGRLSDLYKSDSISIEDKFSSLVFQQFRFGLNENQIKEIIKQRNYEMY